MVQVIKLDEYNDVDSLNKKIEELQNKFGNNLAIENEWEGQSKYLILSTQGFIDGSIIKAFSLDKSEDEINTIFEDFYKENEKNGYKSSVNENFALYKIYKNFMIVNVIKYKMPLLEDMSQLGDIKFEGDIE